MGKKYPTEEARLAAKEASNQRFLKTPQGAASRAWIRLNYRSQGKCKNTRCYEGVEVRMTRQDFYDWAVPKYRQWFIDHPVRETAEHIPSVDRIDPAGHYEISNIQIISMSDNSRKIRTVNDHAPSGTKWCPRCSQFISVASFYSERGRKGIKQLHGECKACVLLRRRDHNAKKTTTP